LKKYCQRCHFLAKETRTNTTGQVYLVSLSENDRNNAVDNPESAVESYYSLKCYMGIWDEGIVGSKKDRDNIINRTPRKKSCYFYPFSPTMPLDTAKSLHEDLVKNQELRWNKSHKTILAFLALVGAIVAIINLFLD
jgi:hypothetical protein